MGARGARRGALQATRAEAPGQGHGAPRCLGARPRPAESAANKAEDERLHTARPNDLS